MERFFGAVAFHQAFEGFFGEKIQPVKEDYENYRLVLPKLENSVKYEKPEPLKPFDQEGFRFRTESSRRLFLQENTTRRISASLNVVKI